MWGAEAGRGAGGGGLFAARTVPCRELRWEEIWLARDAGRGHLLEPVLV